MKKALTLVTLSFLFAGAVGCSTAPKQEDQSLSTETAASSSEDFQQEDNSTVTPQEEEVSSTSSSTTSDLSLGAGSSGRGH